MIFLTLLLFLLLYYCFLSANPWRLDKAQAYSYVPSQYRLWSVTLKTDQVLSFLREQIIRYPVIFKPLVCSGVGKGVTKISSIEEAQSYITQTTEDYTIIQEYYHAQREAGVLVEKLPWNNYHSITSTVIKQPSHGHWHPLRCATRTFLEGDNCSAFCTRSPTLDRVFANISANIPNFYCGRFDVGFNTFEELENGQNLKVYELNGATGFDLKVSFELQDRPLRGILLILRWLLVRLVIGFNNALHGRGISITHFLDLSTRWRTFRKCHDWEKLIEPSGA